MAASTAITAKANLEFRDMEAAGSSVPHEPEKPGIRELFAIIDIALASLGVNGAITVKKATLALLNADLAHIADTLAVVYNDPTPENNGIYAKVGGSGSGSWSLTDLALPSSFADDLAEVLARIENVEAAAVRAETAQAAAEEAQAEIEEVASGAPDAPSVVAKMNKVSTLAALASQVTGVMWAWVAEVNAVYRWEPLNVLPGDGWAIVAPTGGGAGRWALFDDELTVPPLGGATDNTRLQAALLSTATLGKAVRALPAEAGTYGPMGQISFSAAAPVRFYYPGAHLDFNLDPNAGSPANAGLYAAPGGADRTSSMAAANVVSTYTLLINHTVSVGEMLRVRDTATGGFRGNRYTVRAVTPSGGDFLVTVDRPVLTQFSINDAVDIWTSKRAFGHRLYGTGARVTGTGTRMFEFIGTEDCIIFDTTFEPDDCESVASFDTFGLNNHFINCVAVAGSSGAANGFLLETQESSSTAVRANGFSNDGVRFLNDENCIDSSTCWGNAYGIVVGGEANFLGSNNSRLSGVYDGNTVSGLAVVVGSRNTVFTGIARFNPTNAVVGDGDGGNVTDTTLRGDLSNATNIGVTVFSSAVGTRIEADTSGCPFGVNNAGAIVTLAGWRHREAAATNALLCAGGEALIESMDVAVTTAGVNVIQATGAARITVAAGSITAGAASNLFNMAGTSKLFLGAVKGVSSGASNGIVVDAGATAIISALTDFTGVGTVSTGAGTVVGRVIDTTLSANLSALANGGVTTLLATVTGISTRDRVTITPRTAKYGIRTVYPLWDTNQIAFDVINSTGALGGNPIIFDIHVERID